LDMAESLNLVILNDGRTSTFPRGNSFLDLTFATPGIIRKLGTWVLLEEETMSDHQYVFYSLEKTEKTTQPGRMVMEEIGNWICSFRRQGYHRRYAQKPALWNYLNC